MDKKTREKIDLYVNYLDVIESANLLHMRQFGIQLDRFHELYGDEELEFEYGYTKFLCEYYLSVRNVVMLEKCYNKLCQYIHIDDIGMYGNYIDVLKRV